MGYVFDLIQWSKENKKQGEEIMLNGVCGIDGYLEEFNKITGLKERKFFKDILKAHNNEPITNNTTNDN